MYSLLNNYCYYFPNYENTDRLTIFKAYGLDITNSFRLYTFIPKHRFIVQLK